MVLNIFFLAQKRKNNLRKKDNLPSSFEIIKFRLLLQKIRDLASSFRQLEQTQKLLRTLTVQTLLTIWRHLKKASHMPLEALTLVKTGISSCLPIQPTIFGT